MFHHMHILCNVEIGLNILSSLGFLSPYLVFTGRLTQKVYQSAFPHCDKTTQENQLREEKIYFGSLFQGFSPRLTGSTASGLQAKHNEYQGGGSMWQRLLISWQPGSKKIERNELGTMHALVGMSQVTRFFQPSPTLCSFHHLPIMPSNYEWINPPLRSKPHDLITSPILQVTAPLNTAAFGTMPSTHQPLGDIPDPSHLFNLQVLRWQIIKATVPTSL